MNHVELNIQRFVSLSLRVPSYLSEKVYSYSVLRSLVITPKDIEENEYTTDEVAELCAIADEALSVAEFNVSNFGY